MKRLTPNSIKNLPEYIVSNPFGIDMVVNGLQEKFKEFDWLEKSFGRAVYMSHNNTKDKDDQFRSERKYIYPGIFVKEGYDFANLLEVDNYKSYCFFIAHDNEKSEDYKERIRNKFTREISCIFWMNLNEVDCDRDEDFIEEIKRDIIKQSGNARYPESLNGGCVMGVELKSVYDEPDNIFEGFSFDTTNTQFLYYPYRGLRFDFKCYYYEGC